MMAIKILIAFGAMLLLMWILDLWPLQRIKNGLLGTPNSGNRFNNRPVNYAHLRYGDGLVFCETSNLDNKKGNQGMDKLIKLSKKFIDGKIDHITFKREVVDIFRTERFFKDDIREFAEAILSQAILKGKEV